jgi:hypothetical protein
MASESNTALVAPVPPTTFHPFFRLPLELRRKIWAFAANEQRTIKIQEDYIWTVYGDDFLLTARKVKHNAHIVLAILHTSSEARSTAGRHYELYISPRFKNRGFYINFASDTLAIQSWTALSSLHDGLQENQTSWPADILELEQKLKFLGFCDWSGGLCRSHDLL